MKVIDPEAGEEIGHWIRKIVDVGILMNQNENKDKSTMVTGKHNCIRVIIMREEVD